MRSNQLSYRAIQRSGVLVSRLRVQKYDKFSKHQRFSQLFLKKNSLFGILGRKSGVRGIELASLSADFGTWLRHIGDLIFPSLGLKIQKAGLNSQSLRAGERTQKRGRHSPAHCYLLYNPVATYYIIRSVKPGTKDYFSSLGQLSFLGKY